ncbi:unnamed protein product [Closterium sp. Yama58-4]|nr:unnamed protein product [Closterium sp. Yama58-4]
MVLFDHVWPNTTTPETLPQTAEIRCSEFGSSMSSAKKATAVASLKAAAEESAREADAVSGKGQHRGKFVNAHQAKLAKIEAAKAKRAAAAAAASGGSATNSTSKSAHSTND